LQSKKSKEGDNELYHLDKWMMPLAEVWKTNLQNFNEF
jgi:hypothetical protein